METEQAGFVKGRIDQIIDIKNVRAVHRNCHVVLVRKKDGSLRFCLDYREFNSRTKNNAGTLPIFDDAIDTFGSKVFFKS